MVIGASGSPIIEWYITRGTGAVALMLLTIVVVLGVVDVSRLSSGRWPRFLIDGIHQRVSLLAVVFLVIHILTSVIDSYVPIGVLDAVVPFHSGCGGADCDRATSRCYHSR